MKSIFDYIKNIPERTWELIGITVVFSLILFANIYIVCRVYDGSNFGEHILGFFRHYGLTTPFNGIWEGFLILALGCGSIIFMGWEIKSKTPFDFLKPWIDEIDFLKATLTYWGWGFVQHIFVAGLFILLELLNPDRTWNIIIAAWVFSFGMHRPNVVAVMATFGIGILSCLLFKEFHNLYLIGIIHGCFGVSIRFLPEALSTRLYIMSDARQDQKDLNNRLNK